MTCFNSFSPLLTTNQEQYTAGINFYSTSHIDPRLLDVSYDDIECDDIDYDLMTSSYNIDANDTAVNTCEHLLLSHDEESCSRQSSSSDVLSQETEVSDLSSAEAQSEEVWTSTESFVFSWWAGPGVHVVLCFWVSRASRVVVLVVSRVSCVVFGGEKSYMCFFLRTCSLLSTLIINHWLMIHRQSHFRSPTAQFVCVQLYI